MATRKTWKEKKADACVNEINTRKKLGYLASPQYRPDPKACEWFRRPAYSKYRRDSE